MDERRTGRIFGWLFIGTFVTSIPARLLFIDGAGASWTDMRFVTRTMESVFAAIGLISMLSLVSVISAMDGASDAAAVALQVQGDGLAHAYEWAFEWGPGLVAPIGNGLLLGYLMYTSGLVPRRLALLGLVGGSLLILSFLLILAGVYENGEGPSGVLTLPEAAWELSLGIYCAAKGFRPSSTPVTEAHHDEPVPSG